MDIHDHDVARRRPFMAIHDVVLRRRRYEALHEYDPHPEPIDLSIAHPKRYCTEGCPIPAEHLRLLYQIFTRWELSLTDAIVAGERYAITVIGSESEWTVKVRCIQATPAEDTVESLDFRHDPDLWDCYAATLSEFDGGPENARTAPDYEKMRSLAAMFMA